MLLFWNMLFFLMSENVTSNFFPSRLLFRSQLLGSRSQVHSKRFDTRRHNHSFLAAFLKPLLQIYARRDYFALSFFPSFSERQL